MDILKNVCLVIMVLILASVLVTAQETIDELQVRPDYGKIAGQIADQIDKKYEKEIKDLTSMDKALIESINLLDGRIDKVETKIILKENSDNPKQVGLAYITGGLALWGLSTGTPYGIITGLTFGLISYISVLGTVE